MVDYYVGVIMRLWFVVVWRLTTVRTSMGDVFVMCVMIWISCREEERGQSMISVSFFAGGFNRPFQVYSNKLTIWMVPGDICVSSFDGGSGGIFAWWAPVSLALINDSLYI